MQLALTGIDVLTIFVFAFVAGFGWTLGAWIVSRLLGGL
jgi:hypothetical protein